MKRIAIIAGGRFVAGSVRNFVCQCADGAEDIGCSGEGGHGHDRYQGK